MDGNLERTFSCCSCCCCCFCLSYLQVSQSEIPQLFGRRASTLGNYQRQEGVLKGGAAKPRVFSMQKLVEVRDVFFFVLMFVLMYPCQAVGSE